MQVAILERHVGTEDCLYLPEGECEMTATELEASIREWQKTFEKMLMEMTSTTTEDGQAMFFDGIPLVMAFSVAVDGLKNDHNGGNR
jgi:hypothetical protein